jgi:hypothetical protein
MIPYDRGFYRGAVTGNDLIRCVASSGGIDRADLQEPIVPVPCAP